MPDRPSHQVNLLDLLAFLLRWRKFLLVSVFSVAVVVAVISLIVPPKYRSFAVVRTSGDGGQTFGSFLSSRLSALGALSGFSAAMGEVPGEVAIAVLRSRWMSERVIKEFDLRKVYKMETAHPEDLVKALGANARFELDLLASTITITVDDQDPERARAMAQFFVDELDRRNRELKTTMATKEREFTEKRLAEARVELAALEDSLYRFQLATGVLNVEEQVKATIQAAAALEAQRLTAQTELEMNRQLFQPGSPEIQFLQMKLASMDSSLQGLVREREQGDRDFDYMLRLQETPAQGLAYLRLMRDIEIQQLLVGFLLQQYEQSKIEEVRNTPTLVRLDDPVVPTVRVWPRRGLMVGMGAFGALLVFSLVALVVELFQNAARDASHPQHAHLLRVKRALHTVEE